LRLPLNFTAVKRLAVLIITAATAAALGQEGGAPIKVAITTHGDGTRTSTVTDPEKHTTEETLTDHAGKTIRKTIYKLDDRNQPTGATVYESKGRILYTSAYQRDGADRIAEEVITSPAGQLLRRRVYSYGAKNKVARVDEFDGAGNLLIPPQKQSPGRPDKKKR
jgi:hypothetical protein